MMNFVLGIDIGGTKIAGMLLSPKGDILRNERVPTRAYRGAEAIYATALDLAHELSMDRQIDAIGIATGGQVDPRTGTVASASSILPGWTGMALRKRFEDAFGVPCAVDNDVNALAFAEHLMGAAKNAHNVVFVALGTGVGGALLIDGKVYHGARGAGGEFGHLVVDPSGSARFASDGMQGTFEAYCAGAGLVRTWVEGTGSPPKASEEIVADSIAQPGGPASSAIAATGRWLGFGLASLAACLDPDLIVVGGGLASIGEPLLAPAREILRSRLLPGTDPCPVVPAQMGSDSAVLGAALLARDILGLKDGTD
jgi:glucokinase